jgi:raffinose/stachyose/melibiose transport system substrate-binding protein
MSMSKTAKVLSWCSAVLVAALVAGCGGDDDSDTESSGGSPASAEKVTLHYVDDIYHDPVQRIAQEELIRQFEADNPGVTIRYDPKPFAQWVPTAQLTLQGDGAPDVLICAAYDTCNAALVEGGLIIPQETYAEEYGWFEGIEEDIVRETRHEKDGTTWRGESYGPAQTYDLVGLYYNKAKLRELGVEAPKTQAELEDVLAKAKEAGETPIIFGDLAKVDLAYTFMQLLAYEAPPETLRTWMYREDDPDLTEAVSGAAQTLKDWWDKGYFNEDMLGIEQFNAIERFNKGEGVFISTGAWWTGLLTDLGDDAGYMLMPPKNAGDPPTAIFAFSNSMLISSKSEHPDLAAKFIAWMVSPESTPIRVQNGMNATPAHAVDPADAKSQTHRDVLDAMQTMANEGEPVPWLDPSPKMLLEIYGSGLQAVLGGDKSVEDFAAEVVAEQKAQYDERVEKGYAE